MGDLRPDSPEPTQDEQAALLRPTGNGPTLTVEEEERLLREEFGPPDANGVYAAPTEVEGSDD